MYRTLYWIPNGRQIPTSCYARDPAHLAELLQRRGMGETMDPDGYDPPPFGGEAPRMPSYHVAKGELAAANHALVWIGMIACRSDVSEQWRLLNDDGLVHELAHMMHSREDGRAIPPGVLQDFARRLEAFEQLVPGVHPCWAGEDIAPYRPRFDTCRCPACQRDRMTAPLRAAADKIVADEMARFAASAKRTAQIRLSNPSPPRPFVAEVREAKPKGPRGDPNKRGAHLQQLQQREAALQSQRRAALKPKTKISPSVMSGATISIAGSPIIQTRQVELIAAELELLAAFRVQPRMLGIDLGRLP